jgi:hypothetical protein
MRNLNRRLQLIGEAPLLEPFGYFASTVSRL